MGEKRSIDFSSFAYSDADCDVNHTLGNEIKQVTDISVKKTKVSNDLIGIGVTELYKSHGTPESPLKLIIVGHNPSEQSWVKGHFYANPSNRMWKLLVKAGIIPPNFTCNDDRRCPKECGMGFTDLVCGVAETNSNAFNDNELRKYKNSLFDRLANHVERAANESKLDLSEAYPRVIAFSGMRQWKILFPTNFKLINGIKYGIQTLRPPGWPKCLSKSIVFVLSSSSGAAAMSNEDREAPYLELGKLLTQWQWPDERSNVNIVSDASDNNNHDNNSSKENDYSSGNKEIIDLA